MISGFSFVCSTFILYLLLLILFQETLVGRLQCRYRYKIDEQLFCHPFDEVHFLLNIPRNRFQAIRLYYLQFVCSIIFTSSFIDLLLFLINFIHLLYTCIAITCNSIYNYQGFCKELKNLEYPLYYTRNSNTTGG